jgi:hypothetical protein
MPTVGPQTFTNVPIVYDSDSNGLGGPLDMNGPEIGRVRYSRDGAGGLQVRIELEFGHPNTSYTVFLVCGPSHGLACGFTAIDTLVTNALGTGASGTTVPVAALQAPPFGPGYRTDHIDLLDGVGNLAQGALTAGAINYFVCTKEGTPPPREEARRVTSGEGDPLGAQVRDRDPLGARRPS